MSMNKFDILKSSVSPGVWSVLQHRIGAYDDRQAIAVISGSSLHKELKKIDPRFMDDHEKRVVVERDELMEKIRKLGEFIVGDRSIFTQLEVEDQILLESQLRIMKSYRDILNTRINRF